MNQAIEAPGMSRARFMRATLAASLVMGLQQGRGSAMRQRSLAL